MNNSYPSYEAEQFWANCANYEREESVCIFCLNEELPAREPREQSLCDDDSLATVCSPSQSAQYIDLLTNHS